MRRNAQPCATVAARVRASTGPPSAARSRATRSKYAPTARRKSARASAAWLCAAASGTSENSAAIASVTATGTTRVRWMPLAANMVNSAVGNARPMTAATTFWVRSRSRDQPRIARSGADVRAQPVGAWVSSHPPSCRLHSPRSNLPEATERLAVWPGGACSRSSAELRSGRTGTMPRTASARPAPTHTPPMIPGVPPITTDSARHRCQQERPVVTGRRGTDARSARWPARASRRTLRRTARAPRPGRAGRRGYRKV